MKFPMSRPCGMSRRLGPKPLAIRLVAMAVCVLGARFSTCSTAFAEEGEPSKQAGYAPDPSPKASTKQWIVKVTVREGTPRAEQAKAYEVPKPLATPRMMGRYALEFYVGRELLDRLRFNVPLLGEGPPEGQRKRAFQRPRFDQVSVKLSLQVADQPRANRAVLIDRATGQEQHFAWPPGPDGKLVPLPPSKNPPSPSPAPAPTTSSSNAAKDSPNNGSLAPAEPSAKAPQPPAKP